jgi:hypothetical protein
MKMTVPKVKCQRMSPKVMASPVLKAMPPKRVQTSVKRKKKVNIFEIN